ncbi:MAG: Flp pilus assembly complex ATPase component TadA, partial [Clostridiaceae bacterium]|nr:Flp pilus assembly complex ATPase component TadA [Clostridiaceae bacterium]
MKKLGDILIESGLLKPEQLEEALAQQKDNNGKKLGDILIDSGVLTDRQIMKALEYQSRIPYVELNDIRIDDTAPGLISEDIAKKNVLMPIAFEGDQLVVVMNDPLDIVAIDEIRYITGREISPRISTKKQIVTAIEANYGKEKAQKAVRQLEEEFDVEEMVRITEQITDEVANAPVVKLVNSIIEHAIRIDASDIHIEPHEKIMRVRLRVDGVLQEVMSAPKNAHAAVVTRIKIIGGMDIAEKRIPQDGRVETTIGGRAVDMRLSILPTVDGEKIVIRLLGRSDVILSKDALGLSEHNEQLFDRIVTSPNGIILVSGPTGSGKTTTLYTVLKDLNQPTTNIV